MGLFKRDPKKKAERERNKQIKKIGKHMKKNGIGQSDGLEVNEDGDVVYNPDRDNRKSPSSPNRGTPSI